MKARYTVKCERCPTNISVGQQFAVYAGRKWHTQCLLDYQRARRLLRSPP